MQLVFALTAGCVLVSAAAAVLLRKLMHSVLCLMVTFVGLAALFLELGAEFIGFAQILLYVGAVAILIVFAVLLTRSGEAPPAAPAQRFATAAGIGVAVLVFGCLGALILTSSILPAAPASAAAVAEAGSVLRLGQALMSRFVLPLEVLGLLLTAAMIGAVVIAMPERKDLFAPKPEEGG